MSSKVVNIIAIELGILIALLGWLVVARVPSVRLVPRAHEPVQADEAFAPVRRAPPKNLYATNENAARRATAQWPEEQVARADELQQYQTQQYEAADSGAPEYELATDSPNYPQGYLFEPSPGYLADQPEPVLPPDYYFQPSAGFVAFAQPPQVVVFSNNRSCFRSRRSACSNSRRVVPARQRSSGGRQVARGGGTPPRQNAGVPRVRPNPGNGGSVGPRGGNRPRAQAGNGRASGSPISVLQ